MFIKVKQKNQQKEDKLNTTKQNKLYKTMYIFYPTMNNVVIWLTWENVHWNDIAKKTGYDMTYTSLCAPTQHS